MTRVVVVGAGLAGLRTAESLRGAGYRDDIVVVGAEPHPPYNRPPLSKEALTDGLSSEAVAVRVRRSVADVTWRLGMPATSVSLDERNVQLADGESLRYDGLVVATGLRPRRLVAPGPLHGRYVLRTLDDAAALRARLLPGRRVVIVGAGFLGCEIAAAATRRGCAVAVLAPEQVPMQRPLGRALGEALQRHHERRGVRFHFGTGVEAFESADGVVVTGVRTTEGALHPADTVVEAVGSQANVELLSGNALDLSDGVPCDGRLRVPDRPEVVAAGDVARFPNVLYDDVPRRVEHWAMASETARQAGRALASTLVGAASDPAPFAPMPTFWSDQYDVRLQSFGAPELADDVGILEGELAGEVLVGYYRAGVLVGVVGTCPVEQILPWREQIRAARKPSVA